MKRLFVWGLVGDQPLAWLLEEDMGYDGRTPIGVFSTREKGIEAARSHKKSTDEGVLTAFPIDALELGRPATDYVYEVIDL